MQLPSAIQDNLIIKKRTQPIAALGKQKRNDGEEGYTSNASAQEVIEPLYKSCLYED